MCKAKRGPGARGKPTTAVGNRGGSVGMWASYAQPAQALKITLPIRAVYNLSTYPHDPPVIHGLLLPVFLLAYLRACHCAAIPSHEAKRAETALPPALARQRTVALLLRSRSRAGTLATLAHEQAMMLHGRGFLPPMQHDGAARDALRYQATKRSEPSATSEARSIDFNT